MWYITYLKVSKKTCTLNYFKRRENTGTSISEHFFSKLMLKSKTQSSIFSIICDYNLQSFCAVKTYSVRCKCEWLFLGVSFFFFFVILEQVAALWTVPGTSLQTHLLIFPLSLPEGKAGPIPFGTQIVYILSFRNSLWVRSFSLCFSDVSNFILFHSFWFNSWRHLEYVRCFSRLEEDKVN